MSDSNVKLMELEYPLTEKPDMDEVQKRVGSQWAINIQCYDRTHKRPCIFSLLIEEVSQVAGGWSCEARDRNGSRYRLTVNHTIPFGSVQALSDRLGKT